MASGINLPFMTVGKSFGTSLTSWMACSTDPIIMILKPFFKFKPLKLCSSDGALPVRKLYYRILKNPMSQFDRKR